MPFYEIEFPLTGLDAPTVEAALAKIGACALTFQDRADEAVLEPSPGEIRLWPDTLVRALFDDTHDAARCLGELATTLGPTITATARVRAVPEQAWERAWLADWKPMRFGRRLWVCPTHLPPPQDPEAVVLRLDPGLAFGTGTHETTALCLEALAELDLRGKSVLDYGCGSGILAISAVLLGAAHACCVDLDPQALTAARGNAARNGVASRITTQDTAAVPAPADCVLANILAGALIELMPRLTAACKAGGDLLLSGILVGQQEAVIDAYQPYFAILDCVQRGDWHCVRARRRVPTGSHGVS